MMDGMPMMSGGGWMMWIMAGFGLLVVALLLLSVAALAKYLFGGR